MLSKVDRIAERRIPHERLHPIPRSQSYRYSHKILILPFGSFAMGFARENVSDPEKPAATLKLFVDGLDETLARSGVQPPIHVNLKVDRIKIRNTALWTLFFFHAISDVTIECSAEASIEGDRDA